MPNIFIGHSKPKYALISNLTRPDPARPGPARPGPARPDPARPGPARPGPARPGPTGHFDPRVSALKMADLVTPVFAPTTQCGLKIMETLTTSARGIRFRHSRGLLGPSRGPFWHFKNCISTKRPPKAPFGLKTVETPTISARGIRF